MAEVVVGINWSKIIQNIPSAIVEELVTGVYTKVWPIKREPSIDACHNRSISVTDYLLINYSYSNTTLVTAI